MKKEIWINKMRALADKGFIPYAQYMEPFVPEVKYENWSAWRRLLEYEGYGFEKSEFGWITICKSTAEEKETVEYTPEFIAEVVAKVINELERNG